MNAIRLGITVLGCYVVGLSLGCGEANHTEQSTTPPEEMQTQKADRQQDILVAHPQQTTPPTPSQDAGAETSASRSASKSSSGTLLTPLKDDLSAVDVALPMECRGEEPFWHISLTEEAITVRRLGEPTLVFDPATFRPSGGVFLLRAKNEAGHLLQIILVDEACMGSMDGKNYPYTVKVTIDDKHYAGCAQPLRAAH